MNDRVVLLDHLRGLSILGILIVNAIAFAQPAAVYGHPSLIPMSAADWTTWTLIEIFAHDKFVTSFTLLFGISTFLVGREPHVLGRRLVWLAVFGILHGALIWHGDILLLYAVAGLTFWNWRHGQWRRLLVWGLALFIAGTLFVNWPNAPDLRYDPLFVVQMRSGFWGSLTGNLQEWTQEILFEVGGYLPVTLGGMMIGLALFKAGFLSGEAPVRSYALGVLVGAASLGLIAAGVYAAGTWSDMVNGLFCLPVALGYASLLALIGRVPWGRIALYPLACAGRMAFTNYLMQSLIMTAIFYGGRGLSLFGTMAYAALVPIVATVWIAQLILSPLWLRFFRYGPFEWLWRSLSHGRLMPIIGSAAYPSRP